MQVLDGSYASSRPSRFHSIRIMSKILFVHTMVSNVHLNVVAVDQKAQNAQHLTVH